MACPFFYPTECFEDGAWLKPPRVPLGEPCLGRCEANPSVLPSLDELRQFCNCGYARGRCGHFPAGYDGADAVRFSITEDHGASLDVLYIFEKDYGPLRHGPLVFQIATAEFAQPLETGMLEAQARKFIESYLKRRISR